MMTNGREHDIPAAYVIKLRGILDPEWSTWFDGFDISNQDGETLLIGTVIDQAALFGLLGKINDLGLLLLSVFRLETKKEH